MTEVSSAAVQVRKRARLPHWDVDHGTYFVTFNLFDAMPRGAMEKLQGESEPGGADGMALGSVVS